MLKGSSLSSTILAICPDPLSLIRNFSSLSLSMIIGFSWVTRGGRTRRGGGDSSGSGYWKEEIKEVGEHGGVNFCCQWLRFCWLSQKCCQRHLQDFSLISWSRTIVALASWIQISFSSHYMVEWRWSNVISWWNAVCPLMSLVKLEKVCWSSKTFMKASRFQVWRGSMVSKIELFSYVWEKEESEEILEMEFSEKETVDWEEREVIVCKKGLEKVLVEGFVQVHWGWSCNMDVVFLFLLFFCPCGFCSGVICIPCNFLLDQTQWWVELKLVSRFWWMGMIEWTLFLNQFGAIRERWWI